MVIRAAGNDAKTCLLKAVGKNCCILDNLLLIYLELRLKCFVEACSLCRNGVHKRAALCAGEYALIDCFCIFFLAEDDTAAGTAQGLVSGAGDNVSIGYRIHMQTGCNKTCNMCHIDHKDCADFLCNIGNDVETNLTGICTCARNDKLGLAFIRNAAEFIIINALVRFAYAVRNNIEIFSAHVYGAAMRKMTAMGQIHAENRIAGVKKRKINGKVRLCAGMGLNICMFRTKELFDTITGKIFNLVNAFTTAVVTLSGVAFCVFVGEMAAHCRHNGFADEVFGCDELEVAALTCKLLFHVAAKLGIMCPNQIKLDHFMPP